MPTTIAPVTPVLPVEVFAARRAEVMRRMGELVPGGSVLVLSATPVATRNNDVEHPYRADSDLFWLTGFEEPEAVAVLEPAADKPFTLFVRPRDRDRETWTGRRAGVEGAQRAFGADRAFPVGELGARLPPLLEGRRALFYRFGGPDVEFDARIARLIGVLRTRARSGGGAPPRIEDPGQILHELRLRKAPAELSSLRRAVELTRRGHLLAMAKGRPGENNARAEAGELWLIDAGAEVDLYTADVTRTFPVSGRFTPAQRSAYELVLAAADACIAATRPGATIDGLHAQAIQVLVAGMIRLGLLRGAPDKLIEEGAFRRYYMHRTSHWLGLDVHDAGDYRNAAGAPRPLEPGMVFTVEPGLYVAPDDESAPPELRGLGVRIEDDILVTSSGCENLTAAIPRTVAEVEAACLT